MDPLGSTLNGGGGCTPYDRRTRPIPLKKAFVDRPWRRRPLGGAGERAPGCSGPAASGGGCWRRQRDQFGELSEVLGGGGEVELIAGAVRAS
jgi:hypothetical protein